MVLILVRNIWVLILDWWLSQSKAQMSGLIMGGPISVTSCKRKVNKCSAVAELGDRMATIDMGRKEGGCYAPSGGLGPHLTQCHLG